MQSLKTVRAVLMVRYPGPEEGVSYMVQTAEGKAVDETASVMDS